MSVLVALLDSLDSTLDKDSKPYRTRSNDDMRPIAECTGEQRTQPTGDFHNSKCNSDDDADINEEFEHSYKDDNGYDDIDGSRSANNVGTVTENDDDGSDNRVTDTTTRGAAGKTASGLSVWLLYVCYSVNK